MKKLIVLALIAVAAYWAYTHYGSTPGAFDKDGKPKVLLFTMQGCGQPCTDVENDLRNRNVTFEEVDAATDEGRSRMEKFGETGFPLTVIGSKKILGNNLPAIDEALAEAKGMDALTPAEQVVFKNHFDENNKPRVVVYGTETCPYCNRMRTHLDKRHIPYTFVDVSSPDSSGYADFETLHGVGYPLVYVGYRRIDGDNEDAVDQAVKDLMK